MRSAPADAGPFFIQQECVNPAYLPNPAELPLEGEKGLFYSAGGPTQRDLLDEECAILPERMPTRAANPGTTWVKWFTTSRVRRTLVTGYPPASLRYPENRAIGAAPAAARDPFPVVTKQAMLRSRRQGRSAT